MVSRLMVGSVQIPSARIAGKQARDASTARKSHWQPPCRRRAGRWRLPCSAGMPPFAVREPPRLAGHSIYGGGVPGGNRRNGLVEPKPARSLTPPYEASVWRSTGASTRRSTGWCSRPAGDSGAFSRHLFLVNAIVRRLPQVRRAKNAPPPDERPARWAGRKLSFQPDVAAHGMLENRYERKPVLRHARCRT